MSPKTRKFDSGCEKRKKKKRNEELTRSQRGALDKFVIKDVETRNVALIDDVNVIDRALVDENVDESANVIDRARVDENVDDSANVGDVDVIDRACVDENVDDSANVGDVDVIYRARVVENVDENVDIDELDAKLIDILAVNGPKIDLSIVKGPNDEIVDKVTPKILQYETEHWKDVLLRMIAIVKSFGKCNLAFRGTNETFLENNDGNFLGLIEMLVEFDPVMQRHVSRIVNDDSREYFLGRKIQDDFICLLSSNVKSEIVKKIKQAKYYSVILDCTYDSNDDERMSMIVRYVDTSLEDVRVEESFLGFLNVNDADGLGLFDALKNELKSLDLDIDDIRGQGYDSKSDMKGKHDGAQKRLLDLNPRAFYTPCGCHSLNLTLCDMDDTCDKAKLFFGAIQCIFSIFANSTERPEILEKRREILENNVKGLTPETFSTTRWESHFDSVKALRFQMMEIREALLVVEEVDGDLVISSQARSLATYTLDDFKFLVSIVIWYEILYFVDEVSKLLLTKDMLIDSAILQQVNAAISSLEKYRENGFPKAMDTAKQIAKDMDIDPFFSKRPEIRRKNVGESANDVPKLSKEESFRVNFFVHLVDQAISLLKRRFEQYRDFENIFGFLLDTDRLRSIDATAFESCCANLDNALKNNEQRDVDRDGLYSELKYVRESVPHRMKDPIAILNYLKKYGSCFANAMIAYRILLTVPITIASAGESGSKLKLVKSYLRSELSQDRPNELAMLYIENDLLEKCSFEELIDDFASKNARGALIFK